LIGSVIQKVFHAELRLPEELETTSNPHFDTISFVGGDLDVAFVWTSTVLSGSGWWVVFRVRDAIAASDYAYAHFLRFDHGRSGYGGDVGVRAQYIIRW
jgi:hypothetical protein